MGWKMRNLLRPRSIGVCVAVVAVGLLAGGCDWAQFAGGYGHTGDSAGETTITPANVSTITSRFTTVPASQNDGDFISGESAIVNGVMYVVADDGTLYAYDASGSTNCSGTPTTCAPLWTASLGGGSEPNETMPVVSTGSSTPRRVPRPARAPFHAFSSGRDDQLFGNSDGVLAFVDGDNPKPRGSHPARHDAVRPERRGSEGI